MRGFKSFQQFTYIVPSAMDFLLHFDTIETICYKGNTAKQIRIIHYWQLWRRKINYQNKVGSKVSFFLYFRIVQCSMHINLVQWFTSPGGWAVIRTKPDGRALTSRTYIPLARPRSYVTEPNIWWNVSR